MVFIASGVAGLIKPAQRRCWSWKLGCGQTTDVGAYANQRLNLAEEGKAHNGHAEVSNRTREIWPSGIIGGLRETRPWWNCAPTSQSKERDW